MRPRPSKAYRMGSTEVLLNHDRCPRLAHWGMRWQAPNIDASEALALAIDAGVMSEEKDPGQWAGDTIMTIASERRLNVPGSQYDCALHLASLADIIVTTLRTGTGAWARPTPRTWQTLAWESSAFVEAGIRLRRVALVDRWTDERREHELHSWRTLGEQAIYELPMTLTVVVIGNRRIGRYHSPWSKGFLHPRSKNLRIKKRGGESFKGDWVECWREQHDEIERDDWLEMMHKDGVLPEVCFPVLVDIPKDGFRVPIRALAENKMREIFSTQKTPPPTISACDWPRRCKFHDCCWKLKEPTEGSGFVRLAQLIHTS